MAPAPAVTPSGPVAPLYSRVAGLLEKQLREGYYPVGSLLPAEVELATRLKVSRQTIRQAIGLLREAGWLSARKGIGTRVEAMPQDRAYRYTVRSMADLFELARETRLDFHRRAEVAARGALARELRCRAGRHWLHLQGLSRMLDDDRPMGWSELYVEHRLAPVVPDVREPGPALFVRLERYSGQRIEAIDQEIRPTVLNAEQAHLLGTDGLALRVTRRYMAAGQHTLLVSHSTLPADRFVYAQTFRPEPDRAVLD